MRLSPKHLFLGAFIGMGLLWGVISYLPDNKLHIIFCNVGQGDAIYIRYPNQTDMLVDGGPNDKVLTCLARHMPFYDRTIDLVFLSHAEKDHLTGLFSVLKRYSTKYFVSNYTDNNKKEVKDLNALLKQENLTVKPMVAGNEIKLDQVRISALWPENNWLAIKNQAAVLGAASDSTNDLSPYINITYNDFDALLTGDGGIDIQKLILSLEPNYNASIEVFKVPHHGSKTGVSESFLEKIKPKLSVISVGKNSYGHPSQEIINKLLKWGKILRTDENGDIEVVSDGKSWYVK